MQIPLSLVKLLKKDFEKLISEETWLSILLESGLHAFEEALYNSLLNLYDGIVEHLMLYVSKQVDFLAHQKVLALQLGLKKLVLRPVRIQLRTGTWIKYMDYYSKKVPLDYQGDRHLSRLYWHTQCGASPMLSSLMGLFSVVCPSFDISRKVLSITGISCNFERLRQVALSLGERCLVQRAHIQLTAGESVVGKRVVIGIDGGRTRMRVVEEEGKQRDKRRSKYATPWKEPKLFVISTIDKAGKTNRQTLPIYDASFGDDETFELLGTYLKNLKIEQADCVQFVGDGAVWIWRRVRPILISLGVESDKIIETLDYYHAMEHLHQIKAYMDKEKVDTYFPLLKEQLWQGNIVQMARLLRQSIKGIKLIEFTPFQYFVKNQQRIDYQGFRARKLLCGSGLLESGIRRMINLRFKSPAAFWYPDNVEKLILLRSIALAGRWNIMINNITKPY